MHSAPAAPTKEAPTPPETSKTAHSCGLPGALERTGVAALERVPGSAPPEKLSQAPMRRMMTEPWSCYQTLSKRSLPSKRLQLISSLGEELPGVLVGPALALEEHPTGWRKNHRRTADAGHNDAGWSITGRGKKTYS